MLRFCPYEDLYILLGFCGVYFLESAATEDGLLPSGHGTGRWSEITLGVGPTRTRDLQPVGKEVEMASDLTATQAEIATVARFLA